MIEIPYNAPIDIYLNGIGRTRVHIGDMDLSNVIYRVELAAEFKQADRLVLYCRAVNVNVHGEGHALFRDRSAKKTESPPQNALPDDTNSPS